MVWAVSVAPLARGGEQDPEPVVLEIPEAMGEPADLLDDQVDGLGAAVGDAGGVEVGRHLLAPGLEGAAEPAYLGDRAAGEAVQHLVADRAALPGAGVVDRAELLVALPGEVDLSVRVAGVQAGGDLDLLLVGEVHHAVAEQAADLVERVLFVAAVPTVSCCTRRRTSST